MKYICYILIPILLLLVGCSNFNKNKNIEQEDVDFVESLEKANKKDHINSIDSVLQIAEYNDAKTALLYFKKGKIQSTVYAYVDAIENLNKALQLFEKLNAKKHIPETYWNLGSANAFLSNKVLANEQLLQALQLCKEIDDKQTEAKVYGSLAHVHYLYKDFLTSIEYTKKAIEIHKIQKDTFGLSATYNNLAVIYKNINNYEQAIAYNNKSLDLNILQKDTAAIAMSYNNIGNLYSIVLGDEENGIKYFLQAAALNKSKELLNSSPLENLGNSYARNNDFEKSKYYYLEALAIEKVKTSTAKRYRLINELLEIALLEKDFEKAVLYQQKSDSLRNVLATKDSQEKLDLVENQYQLAASQQSLKQEQRINKKNRIIFLIILGFVLLLALAWFLYEKNKKLKTEKEKIYLEQKVLRSQMNPHFIFNVLSSIQNSLMDNDPIKSATYLSKFAKLFRQNFDFINKKTISLRDEIDVLENYVSAQKLRYKDKFEYRLKVSDDVDIDIIEIPPLLLQPFIENAIEHGFKNKKDLGKITVTISNKNNAIWYEISDNGKGFDITKKSSKIHALDIFKKRLKLLGNDDEKSLKINSSSEGTTIKFKLTND